MSPFIEELRKQDILEQLIWDDSVNANDIHVDVEGRNVQLKGQVPNFASKIAATNAAFRVNGVKNVENYLKVQFPPSDTLPHDTEITSNIKDMLKWNSKISAENIEIETQKGIVTLGGSVSTYWERMIAEDIASNIRGALEVNNKIDVKTPQVFHDVNIERDIVDAYRRSRLIDEEKVEVSVTDGIVTLNGTASSFPLKKETLEIATYTAGVKGINDQLYIE